MPTPAAASGLPASLTATTYKGQIREIMLGAKVLTVGPGGDYTTLKAAMTARAALSSWTLVTSFTGTTTGTRGGREITAGGTEFAGYEGQTIGVELESGHGIYNFTPLLNNRGYTDLPIQVTTHDAGTAGMNIYTPDKVVILLLPGTVLEEDVTSSINFDPNTIITTFAGMPAQVKLFNTTGSSGTALFTTTSLDTNVIFQNIILTMEQHANTTPAVLFRIGDHTKNYDHLMDTRFINCQFNHGRNEGIRCGSEDTGRVDIIGCDIKGAGFNINVPRAQILNVSNCELASGSRAAGSTRDGTATNINLGLGSGVESDVWENVYGRARMKISNNNMRCYSEDPLAFTDAPYGCVDVSGFLATSDSVEISNNYLYANGSNGSTAVVAGVRTTTATGKTNTPNIMVHNNVFNITSIVAAGSKDAMRADSYAILEANNYAEPGSVVTHTTTTPLTVI